jgi:hypothetical protein
MPLAALLAMTLFASEPPAPDMIGSLVDQTTSASAMRAAPDDDDIPAGAPTDPYGFVAWCYGALGEYLDIYDGIKPELKDIDARFGTSVVESEPYMTDVAGERMALKRFAAAMEAAERASPTAISEHGVEAMDKGRSIWAAAKLQSKRKLADAWLFWGVPNRCETTAKTLKTRSTLLGQAMATGAPSVDAPPQPKPQPAPAPAAAPPPRPEATPSPDAPIATGGPN